MKWLRARRPDPYGLLVLIVGVLVLLEAFLRHVPERVEALLPFLPESTSRRALFVIGILLIYLSEQISRRKRAAWLITIVVLVSLVIVTISRHFAWPLLALYSATLVFFIKEKNEFNVRSDTTSLRRATIVAGLQIGLAVVVIATIFTVLDQREFGRHLTTSQTFHYTVNALFSETLPPSVRVTHYDEALIDMLRYTVLFMLALVVWSLFRPTRLRSSSSRVSRNAAQAILQSYSHSPEDFFKLYPHDKHYFFYSESFVAYAVKSGIALVLDGGTGPVAESAHLRVAFAEHCRRNGWRIAVIHADESERTAWQALDVASVQIGSEAVIDSRVFTSETVRNKHFRYVLNRARKDDLAVEWWQPPLSSAQLDNLRTVSDAWIANGKQEYTFVMGPFSDEYIRDCQIAVLRQGTSIVAYANLLPTYGAVNTASVDHMRSIAGVSSVAMHFLLKACIEKTHADGYEFFNLGFVPLAKIDEAASNVSGRIVTAIRQMSSGFYSSQGLEQFKGKFEPQWSSRYLLYQGGIRQLPLIAASLMQLTSYRAPSARRRLPVLPVLLITLSSFLYASFPLAYFLNRPYAWQGLVSVLGADGQPYAWFFNAADIVSSALAIGVFAWLLRYRRPQSRTLYYALLAALLAVLGAFIAAVVSMPDEPAGTDGRLSLALLHSPAIIVHGLASFLNSGAFVVAAVLWAAHYRHPDSRSWRTVLALLIVLISTVGFVVGQIIPGWAGTLQRVFILLYAVWFVVFTIDLLRDDNAAQS